MSEPQHAPGPWEIDELTAEEVSSFAASLPLFIRSGETDVCYVALFQNAGADGVEEIHKANARLLAAAPEMLEALRSLMTNPHVILGDLVYQVRESEGQGWEGPAVTAWSKAVTTAEELVKRFAPREGSGLPTVYLFYREDGFYPLTLRGDADAIANAECNPRTVKVENAETRAIVWEAGKEEPK